MAKSHERRILAHTPAPMLTSISPCLASIFKIRNKIRNINTDHVQQPTSTIWIIQAWSHNGGLTQMVRHEDFQFEWRNPKGFGKAYLRSRMKSKRLVLSSLKLCSTSLFNLCGGIANRRNLQWIAPVYFVCRLSSSC